jgi:phosphohistidine phosphatase
VRTLLILRHSKSGHDQPVSDKQRTLTSQGRKDARRMGELARERNSIPDRVLCSTATRARETIEFFAQGAKLKQPIDFLDALYLADPAAILRVIREHARASELVMVVGHNPGLEGLVAKLTGEHVELPTTGLAECALPIQSWSELDGKINPEEIPHVSASNFRNCASASLCNWHTRGSLTFNRPAISR